MPLTRRRPRSSVVAAAALFSLAVADLSAAGRAPPSFSFVSRSRRRSDAPTPTALSSSSSSRTHLFPHRHHHHRLQSFRPRSPPSRLGGWVEGGDGEWEWEEEDGSAYVAPTDGIDGFVVPAATATPSLPGGEFRPKQSLGQNYLRDGNTVTKIVGAFAKDAAETLAASRSSSEGAGAGGRSNAVVGLRAVELGPGAGALTDVLVKSVGVRDFQCIEIDDRSVELLGAKHPSLRITSGDVLQVDYVKLASEEGGPLSVIGNLPYYITSQILFALADASHSGSVRSATVTMQWEVAQRIVAPTRCKAYGILSVVFQLYADCNIHFKIPPTVFYPQPKVDSALVGLRFHGPAELRRRLGGVDPANLRIVVGAAFRQRRKTVRNSLKRLARDNVFGGDRERASVEFFDADVGHTAADDGIEGGLSRELPTDWPSKRAEELTPLQFVEITRLLYGPPLRRKVDGIGGDDALEEHELATRVWRKSKHGAD